MDLQKAILETPPREQSGSDMADRVAYQIDWVLAKTLELHQKSDDYLIVLEYHDDVIIFDSEDNPTSVAFYQVKTKDGKYWLLSDLLAREAGKDAPLLSIIGKLYGGKILFTTHTKSLNLISNARYHFKLKESIKTPSLSLTEIPAADLNDDDIAKITSQLMEEYELKSNPEFADITFFWSVDLSLKDHSTHARGKLNDYLNHRFSGRKFNITTIYRVLYDELKGRNNRKFVKGDFVDLVTQKGVSRKSFEQALVDTGVHKDLDEGWQSIEAQLRHEGVSLKEIFTLKSEWRRCELDRMDPTNDVVQEIVKTVRVSVKSYDGSDTLQGLLDAVVPQCDRLPVFSGIKTIPYLRAMILMEFYEQQQQQV